MKLWFADAEKQPVVPSLSSDASLDQLLERLRVHVNSGKIADIELLALAQLLCKTGESLKTLSRKVHGCLETGDYGSEARLGILASMQDLLSMGESSMGESSNTPQSGEVFESPSERRRSFDRRQKSLRQAG